MKGTEHFTRTIAEYLNQRAMTDPLFAPNLLKPNKNIEECITYILNEVQKAVATALMMMRSSLWLFTTTMKTI